MQEDVYEIKYGQLLENGGVLGDIGEEDDWIVVLLWLASRRGRLAWEGQEALREGEGWNVYKQTRQGLRLLRTFPTLGRAWVDFLR